jgi:hypothetical protein
MTRPSANRAPTSVFDSRLISLVCKPTKLEGDDLFSYPQLVAAKMSRPENRYR